LLTTPNDIEHEQQPAKGKINWDLVTNQTQDLTDYLRAKMFPKRYPPLVATNADKTNGFGVKIYYLMPGEVEESAALDNSNYTNNISIVTRINYKGKVLLIMGDMMKDGTKEILNVTDLGSDLEKYGVDFLIAPHHGLRSSFSTDLFRAMKGGKTRQLNIISERPTNRGSQEIVDERYGLSDYCKGCSVLINSRFENKRKVRTSVFGHVKIRIKRNGDFTITTGDLALR
jgi:hypothetical protein